MQADNANYRSDIRAGILGTAKSSSKFDVFLRLLRASAAKVELKVELPLARMPTGTFTITPTTVLAGDGAALDELATFTVELDSATFLTFNAIDHIEILLRRDGTNLDIGRTPCTQGAAEQSTFTCNAAFLEEHEGVQSFHAFVHAKIFGVPLPIPLEINPDARATVDVLLCQPTAALSPTGLAAIAPSQQVCETEPTDPALAGIEAMSGVLLGASTWAGCGTGVEDRQEHGHMYVSDYANQFTANSQWVRADSDGNEQLIDTEAVSDLTLVAERDADGRVTSWSGVNSATLRATAQSTQFDREMGRASCHGQASAFFGASLGETDSSSLAGIQVVGEAVAFSFEGSVRFGGEDGADGGQNRVRFFMLGYPDGNVGVVNLFDHDVRSSATTVSESGVREPGRYTLHVSASTGWRKPQSCDPCKGSAGYAVEFAMGFSEP